MTWNFEVAAGPYDGGSDGLAWDGEAVLFALVKQSKIMRYHPATGRVAEYRQYTLMTKGLAFGPDGLLYGCQSTGRRVVRFGVDGSLSMMAERLDGRPHNQPDDLVIDSGGRIWYTDPDPGAPFIEPFVDHASVLRLRANDDGVWGIERMTNDTVFPTGVALSPDERTLYVGEHSKDASGQSELRAYPIRDDGSLGPRKVLHTFNGPKSAHGMSVDDGGNVLVCVGGAGGDPPAIMVFSATGQVLESHPFEVGQPNNCAFGDPDLSALYVTTAEGHLCRARDAGRRGSAPPRRR